MSPSSNPRNPASEAETLSPAVSPAVSKEAWLAACHFHDVSEQQVLSLVADRVRSTPQPLVLLDLDSTLYEVGPRTYQILTEWLDMEESHPFRTVRDALLKLESVHIGYSLRDTFRAVGLSLEDPETHRAWERAKKFWSARFFSNSYLRYDRPYPGSVEFSRKLYDLGAEIIYLTGRDEPGMGEGTRQRLTSDGFPWGVPRTHLLLKPESSMSDLQHKVDAATYIRRHGTLIASFENEPKNLSALYGEFPDAMHVFVDTVSSDHEAVPCVGLYRIRGFATE